MKPTHPPALLLPALTKHSPPHILLYAFLKEEEEDEEEIPYNC